MEGHSAVPKFDPFVEPSTLGPRWTRWLSGFELFADGKGLIIEQLLAGATAESVQRQHVVRQRRRALLLHSAGPDVQDIFLTLTDTGERREYDVAVTALNNYFVPKANAALARQVFHGINPAAGETIQQFATRLKKAALDCAYGDETDNNIRDAILWKCPSSYIKRRLLEEGDELTLIRTLTLAAQCENIETQISSRQDSLTSTFRESSRSEKVNHLKWKNSVGDGRKHQKSGKNVSRKETRGEGNRGACFRCGAKDHYSRDPHCPAIGKECSKCHKRDHFAKVCKTKRVNCVDLGDLDLGHQDGASGGRSSDRHDHEYAFRIGVNTVNTDDLLEVEMGGVKLHVLADSGAYSNVIDERTWEQLKAKHIKCTSNAAPQNKQIYAYASDKPLEIKGTFECEVRAGKGREKAEFVVVKGRGVPLLGKQTATKLGMMKVGIDVGAVTSHAEQFRHEFPEVFTGLGKMKDTQITLHVDPNVTPVAQPLRRTPFQLRERVEEKLKQLVELDIIEPVAGPTPWVNPTVIAPKRDGDIRLCIDMRRANEAIIRERHPIPTVDEVLQGLNGSKVFSELDLNMGYHQLELEPKSRDITTFATHSGLYRYKRLLFGVNSASEVFQYKIASALAGIEGATNISDNIVVHAADKETHDKRLRQVLERMKAVNLTLNWEKCKIGLTELAFFGYLVSEKGIGPTEERVRAVVEARQPENMHELRSFLGLVNYSARFIPGFATISEPLRKLTRKDVPFVFGREQCTAFSVLKKKLTNAMKLAHFDKEAPTKVIADASPVGLGAVLVQEQSQGPVVVSYASRSLSDVERRYSQTEKEALGLVWACEKFHPYIYGKCFELLTDHKPLEAIYAPKSKPCARIERWVLRLQPYEFKVIHLPGKNNIADPLSRLLKVDMAQQSEFSKMAEEHVRFVAINSTPKAMTTHDVERASSDDAELQQLRECIDTGR